MRSISHILLAIMAVLFAVGIQARTRTTQHGLNNADIPLEQIERTDSCQADSCHDKLAITTFNAWAVSLAGYNKRASDSRESFLITNNTNHNISHVTLLLRYTTLNGELIHERTVTVDVSLKPGETKMASVSSFDKHRAYYYYAGSKPRKAATPFKVAFALKGYDIPVTQ
ncbi:MAG: hypothetical protein IK092_02190 [Muribaculaceae bacterium]|nr:hypothetical protein [Muribaculaceae bacterium]